MIPARLRPLSSILNGGEGRGEEAAPLPGPRPAPASRGEGIKAFAPGIGYILTNLHESRALAKLRNALLPELLSGELRVKDAYA